MSSEAFADWVSMFVLCLMMWLVGRWGRTRAISRCELDLIHIPPWLAILVGWGRNSVMIPIRSLAFQLTPIFMLLVCTIVVLFEPDPGRRKGWMLVDLLVALLFNVLSVVLVRILLRGRRRDK